MKLCLASVLILLPALAYGFWRHSQTSQCETIISAFTVDKTYLLTTRRTLIVSSVNAAEETGPAPIPVITPGQTAASEVHFRGANNYYILFSCSAPNGYEMYNEMGMRQSNMWKLLKGFPEDTAVEAALGAGENLVLFSKTEFVVTDRTGGVLNRGSLEDLRLPNGVTAAWSFPEIGALMVIKGDELYTVSDRVDFSRRSVRFDGPYKFSTYYRKLDITLCPA